MHADFSALQAFAGIVTVSVGHCHPGVVDAVKRQSELLQHTTTIYLNPQIALYAKELTDRLPGNLKVRAQTLFRCLHNKSVPLHRTHQASMAAHALFSTEVMQPPVRNKLNELQRPCQIELVSGCQCELLPVFQLPMESQLSPSVRACSHEGDHCTSASCLTHQASLELVLPSDFVCSVPGNACRWRTL